MEPATQSGHLGPISPTNGSSTPATPKKGRFGLPADPALAEKITQTAAKAPATNIKEAGKPVIFAGEKLSKDEKAANVFKNGIPKQEFQSHRNGELIIKEKSALSVRTGKTEVIENKETRAARLAEIESIITRGEATFAQVNHEKKTIAFTRLNKKIDLNNVNNGFIVAGNDVVPLNIDDHPADLADYHFTTDDKSLQQNLSTLRQNFVNGNVFIATSEEIKTLNELNQKRFEVKNDDKKQDNTQNTQQQVNSNPQTTTTQPKVKESDPKKERIQKKESFIKESVLIDREKDAKAAALKKDEEFREQKRKEAKEATQKNEERIDAEVLDRIKPKN